MPERKGRILTWILAIVASLSILFERLTASSKSKLSPESLRAGHETSDASAKGLMWFGIGFILSAIFIHLGLVEAFFVLRRNYQSASPRDIETQLLSQRKPPSEPRLQSNPSADLQTYLKQEEKILSSYSWIDQKEGVVRIPIDRAMTLYVEQMKERVK